MPKRICKSCNKVEILKGKIRSDICLSCSRKLNPPRLGTGKGWSLNEGTGYIMKSLNGRKLYQHRYIMEQHLGRELETNEHVHHKDGDRTNNYLKNLVLMNATKHHRAHNGVGDRLSTYKGKIMLKCTTCETSKPLSEYPRRKNRPLGVHGICNMCRRPKCTEEVI